MYRHVRAAHWQTHRWQIEVNSKQARSETAYTNQRIKTGAGGEIRKLFPSPRGPRPRGRSARHKLTIYDNAGISLFVCYAFEYGTERVELQCRRVKRNGSRALPSVVHKRVDEIVLHLHAHDTRLHNAGTQLVQVSTPLQCVPAACSFASNISSNTFAIVIGRTE